MRGIIRPLRSVYIVVWCNGNTADFGSAFQGSNPCATTINLKKMERTERIEIKKRIKEYWDNLPRFETSDDIPELPTVDEKEWKEFYVPKLIDAGAIPKKDLIDGQIYIGKHRNANIQRWNAKKDKFDHLRYKFGWREDECNHFEDDDGFALFVPIGLGTQEDWDNRLK